MLVEPKWSNVVVASRIWKIREVRIKIACNFKVTFIYVFLSVLYTRQFSGDNNEEEIPVPMPNTEVKLLSAEDTYELPCWENRKLPVLFFKKNIPR